MRAPRVRSTRAWSGTNPGQMGGGPRAGTTRKTFASAHLTGWHAIPLRIAGWEGEPSYFLVVAGRIGPIEYTRSDRLGSDGPFPRLRGLVLNEAMWDGSDFVVPENRDSVLVTERVGVAIESHGLTGFHLIPLTQVEFYLPTAPSA